MSLQAAVLCWQRVEPHRAVGSLVIGEGILVSEHGRDGAGRRRVGITVGPTDRPAFQMWQNGHKLDFHLRKLKKAITC